MTTVDVAEHIGELTGYVRNTDADTVQGEVQGSQAKIDKFIKAVEKAPVGRVDRVETKQVEEKSGETGFHA